MSHHSVAAKRFALVLPVMLALAGPTVAWAQDATVAPSAPHVGPKPHAQPKPKPAPKTAAKPKEKEVSKDTAGMEIIPCSDAKGVVHKCIRIDPTAGEINDTAKGASYRMIYGQ